MTVRDLIAELSKYPQNAEVRFAAACVLDEEEDCLVGTVTGVRSPEASLCIIDCNGVSDEDQVMLDKLYEDD